VPLQLPRCLPSENAAAWREPALATNGNTIRQRDRVDSIDAPWPYHFFARHPGTAPIGALSEVVPSACLRDSST